LYASPNIIRMTKSLRGMGAAWSTHGKDKKRIQIFVRKTWRKKRLERPRCKWEDNIRKDLGETGWEDVDLMHLARRGTSGGLL